MTQPRSIPIKNLDDSPEKHMVEALAEKRCVFCAKFDGLPADVEVTDFEPLNPVAEGHRLVVPRKHVAHFAEDPKTSAKVMEHAAYLSQWIPSFNIVTSKGKNATQSVFHLHVHIIPRREGDGLKLPWTGQKKEPQPEREEEDWEDRFERSFSNRHSAVNHLSNDQPKKRDCQICREDRETNPKGYYKTFLHEQKCYWNDEMFQDVKAFIRSLLSNQKEKIRGEVGMKSRELYEEGCAPVVEAERKRIREAVEKIRNDHNSGGGPCRFTQAIDQVLSTLKDTHE